MGKFNFAVFSTKFIFQFGQFRRISSSWLPCQRVANQPIGSLFMNDVGILLGILLGILVGGLYVDGLFDVVES